MFAMGLFLLQDGVHAKFDSHRTRFFWVGAGTKRKYHLVNWPAMCRAKEAGGLGIINSKKMTIALTLKWILKLYQGDNSLWAQIITAKYVEARDIFSGMSHGGSPF
jgi:isocitrate dehydrogenase kinase/phosphatase